MKSGFYWVRIGFCWNENPPLDKFGLLAIDDEWTIAEWVEDELSDNKGYWTSNSDVEINQVYAIGPFINPPVHAAPIAVCPKCHERLSCSQRDNNGIADQIILHFPVTNAIYT